MVQYVKYERHSSCNTYMYYTDVVIMNEVKTSLRFKQNLIPSHHGSSSGDLHTNLHLATSNEDGMSSQQVCIVLVLIYCVLGSR